MADTSFIVWVQQFAEPWLTNLFLGITSLGSMEYYIVAIPAIYWLIDKHLGFRFALLLIFSAYTNSGLKYRFAAPRPPLELRLTVQDGYSFPSGHAQGSTVFWGFLAMYIKKPWAWVGAVVMAGLISFSRIYLGVHYPIDIIGGIALGILLLWGYHKLRHRFDPLRVSFKIWVLESLGAALLLYLIHPTGDGPMTVGFMLGALLGYGLDVRTIDFSPKGSLGSNIAKMVLGITGLLGLRIILRPVTNLLPGTLGDVVRYTFIGFWAAYGAPYLFVRLGLTQQGPGSVSSKATPI